KQQQPNYEHFVTWKDETKFKFNYVEGIDIDSKRHIYVADEGNHIRKFDTKGNLIKEWGSQGSEDGQFKVAYAVAIDSKDSIYVSAEGGGRIQKFDTEGNFIMKWGTLGSGDRQFSS